MAKHSVDVLIKARDEASRKFGVIATSAAVMGRTLKSVASMTRTAFAAAFRTVKRVAIGLAAAFAYCTYAAMKQEKAEISLKGVLIGLGKYTKGTMEDFKKFASEMQEVTTYGDEYVLSLLGVAMAQTKSSESAKKIVSDMIALKEIIPAGRMRLESFMKMVLGFHQGSKELDTYLIRLKGVTDETKRQRIYNEYLKAAWGLWEEKINSTQDALTQMKNKLGDIAEAIGTPFLPSVKAAAKAVKNWAKENEADIALWAKKFHSSVVFLKDVMWDFVKFMREDWRAGLKFVFDAFLKMMKATFQSAVMLAIAGGKGIWKGIKEGLLGGDKAAIEKEMNRIYEEQQRFAYPGRVGIKTWEEAPLLHQEDLRRIAEINVLKRKTESILKGSLEAIADTWKDTFKEILKDMPAELRAETKKAWEKHLQRIKELTKPTIPGEPPPSGTSEPSVPQLLKELVRQGLHLKPTRFLTFGAGARFDYTKETARNTNNTVKTFRMIERYNRNMEKLQQRQVEIMRDQGIELKETAFA